MELIKLLWYLYKEMGDFENGNDGNGYCFEDDFEF